MTTIKIPWPDWEPGEEIGHGGFGTVYAIHNQISGEESALKVITIPKDKSEISSLRLEGYDDQSVAGVYKDRLDKVVNEYKLMAKMKSHPNVVRCEDFACTPHEDGIGWDIYIRMEKLESLPRLLMRKTFDQNEVVRLGIDILSALELCDSMSIVHRDIKPENIFFSEYSGYKLGDFGISRTMDHTTNATMTGSYRYMAPEVYKNKPYDKTVDIYSLGLVLYWLLNNRRMPFLPTDRPPKASENDAAIEKRMSGKRMAKPLNGSDELKAVVMKACAYNMKNRYQSAEEMKQALEAVDVGAGVISRPGETTVQPGGESAGTKTTGGGTRKGGNIWHDGGTVYDGGETVGVRTGGKTKNWKATSNSTIAHKPDQRISVLQRIISKEREISQKKAAAGSMGFFQKAKKKSLEMEADALRRQQ